VIAKGLQALQWRPTGEEGKVKGIFRRVSDWQSTMPNIVAKAVLTSVPIYCNALGNSKNE